MALLYRMGTGNGSGGDLKPFIVNFTCDSGFVGKTITMEFQGTPHAGETVDNVSGIVASDGTLTFYPMHDGLWKYYATSDVSGYHEETITLEKWGNYPVEFNDTPEGATVTPTDDVQTWLHCGNIWDKTDLTTINDVIADTTTLNTLISDNNASDYLVRSTTFATDICSNESAMTYIGLNDYCANKLLSDSTWLTAICSTEETLLKKVLNVFVPTLTSNTGSDGGVASGSSEYDKNRKIYMAFDGLATSWCSRTQNAGEWIQYDFKKNVKISYMVLKEADSLRFSEMKISGSNDNGANFTDIITITTTSKDVEKAFINNEAYQIYRLTSTKTNSFTAISNLQFYGREA